MAIISWLMAPIDDDHWPECRDIAQLGTAGAAGAGAHNN